MEQLRGLDISSQLSAFSLSVKALPIQDVGVLQLSNTLIGSAILSKKPGF
ncbi:MAG: hypothetical protein F6J93_25445 [Oscillatoria sp. SIO1A7]|nr:hypothetical protein [Oscillatoria sp. SIO1A7]